MRQAAFIGIRYEDFLKMTPRILNVYINAYNKRVNEENQNLITHAYLVAAWTRAKKLPDKNKILNATKEKPKKMTDEEMFQEVLKFQKNFT